MGVGGASESVNDTAAVGKQEGEASLPEFSTEGLLLCCPLDWSKSLCSRISSLPSDWWGCGGVGSALPSVPLPALRPGPFLSSMGAKEQLCRWQAACLIRRGTLAAALLVCR